jgi:putative ABC transport system ATP-binding protein
MPGAKLCLNRAAELHTPNMTDTPTTCCKDDELILRASDIHKSFGKGEAANHVLRGVGLSVRRGEFLAIMGPSGCGKSTLLHLLGLISTPDAGNMTILGKDTSEKGVRNHLRRREIGFVFQRFNLLGVLSARDNILMSLKVRGLGRSTTGRADELLDAMGVAHVAKRKPGQMSIGEQQRVAVARALAHQPSLLLADEPTGNLDTANSHALLELLRDINRRIAQTLLLITHSHEAAQRADRILHMRDGLIHDRPDA